MEFLNFSIDILEAYLPIPIDRQPGVHGRSVCTVIVEVLHLEGQVAVPTSLPG